MDPFSPEPFLPEIASPPVEFHILTFSDDSLRENKGGDVQLQLNGLGEEGWDIATTFTRDDGHHTFILRRIRAT